MKQTTKQTLFDALLWIHTQPHYVAGLDYDRAGVKVLASFYANHHEKMRVPNGAAWTATFHSMIEPNRRSHDDRMYALTPAGKKLLYELMYKIEPKPIFDPAAHP